LIVITVARRPLSGTVAESALEHGTGPINVDACRVAAPGEEISSHTQGEAAANRDGKVYQAFAGGLETHQTPGQKLGRWPANLILEHKAGCRKLGEIVEAWECVEGCPVDHLDRSVGTLTSGKPAGVKNGKVGATFNEFNDRTAGTPLWGYGDTGGASRFFKIVQGGG